MIVHIPPPKPAVVIYSVREKKGEMKIVGDGLRGVKWIWFGRKWVLVVRKYQGMKVVGDKVIEFPAPDRYFTGRWRVTVQTGTGVSNGIETRV